jgi:hypothetical protein
MFFLFTFAIGATFDCQNRGIGKAVAAGTGASSEVFSGCASESNRPCEDPAARHQRGAHQTKVKFMISWCRIGARQTRF